MCDIAIDPCDIIIAVMVQLYQTKNIPPFLFAIALIIDLLPGKVFLILSTEPVYSVAT